MNSEWNMRHTARVAPEMPHALPRDAEDVTTQQQQQQQHIAENSNYHNRSSHHSLLFNFRFFDAM